METDKEKHHHIFFREKSKEMGCWKHPSFVDYSQCGTAATKTLFP